MTTKLVQAFVVHKYWSGDTSARVIFFTRELGVVHCLCKGGRTPKKQALLQAFTPLWLSLNERYERHYMHHLESSAPMLSLTGHSLFSALYINELLYYALSPLYPDPRLFDAYLFTLNALASNQDRLSIEALLRRFEWALLLACGQSFSLQKDAQTGKDIIEQAFYQFRAGEGLVLAQQGIPGASILAIAADNLNEAATLKYAKVMMRQAIDSLLDGREIKARALYTL